MIEAIEDASKPATSKSNLLYELDILTGINKMLYLLRFKANKLANTLAFTTACPGFLVIQSSYTASSADFDIFVFGKGIIYA